MNRRAVFLDVDGTLVDHSGGVPTSAQDAVRAARANGHLVFLCTGRFRDHVVGAPVRARLRRDAAAGRAQGLGLAREGTPALGDSDSDLEMLRHAGVGIAMGNARPHVLDAADEVTSAPEEDGVHEAFRRHRLVASAPTRRRGDADACETHEQSLAYTPRGI